MALHPGPDRQFASSSPRLRIQVRIRAGIEEREGRCRSWKVRKGGQCPLIWISTLEDLTLYRLFVLKFEILLQIAPAFYLGINFTSLSSRSILLGLCAGLATAIVGWSAGAMPLGLHPGTLGLMANVLVVVASHYVLPPAQPAAGRGEGLP